MKGKRTALAACALALAVALGGCQLFGGGAEKDAPSPDRPVVSDLSQEGAVPTDPSEDSMVIETEFGDLYYPAQWSEYVVTSQEASGDSLSVEFAARIGEGEYPMFKVTIGDSEDTEVGELTDDSGTARPVHMSVYELEEAPELSEEEQQRVVAMQEDLNYVIDHLA